MDKLFENWRAFLNERTKPFLRDEGDMELNAQNISNATNLKVLVAQPGSRYTPYEREPVYYILSPEQGNKTGHKEARFQDAYTTAWYMSKKLGMLPEEV
jgi:hypothetical protein